MMKYSIDRFEEQFAVLIGTQGEKQIVSREKLPENAAEGDILLFNGTAYILNRSETEEKRGKARKLINRLFQDQEEQQ